MHEALKTVGEFIEALSEYPRDARVWAYWESQDIDFHKDGIRWTEHGEEGINGVECCVENLCGPPVVR